MGRDGLHHVSHTHRDVQSEQGVAHSDLTKGDHKKVIVKGGVKCGERTVKGRERRTNEQASKSRWHSRNPLGACEHPRQQLLFQGEARQGRVGKAS